MEIFKPEVGMTTKDSHIRGVTDVELINVKGTIEYIGVNYFLLRLENNSCVIIKDKNYWQIPLNKFKCKK